MKDVAQRWSIECEEMSLPHGFAYAVARVASAKGALAHLDGPVMVGAREMMVVMLSTSGGMLSAEPRAVVESMLTKLLKAHSSTGERAILQFRQRLFELFERGDFAGAVPSGSALVVSPGGAVSGVSFGPVGVAAVGKSGVRLLLPDDRFRALEKSGVRLENVLPNAARLNPLVLAVTSLTQLDTADRRGCFSTRVEKHQSVMLMSRGVLPIDLPSADQSLEAWSMMEAGWSHGMSGAVVHVYRPDVPLTCKMFPWIVHRENSAMF